MIFFSSGKLQHNPVSAALAPVRLYQPQRVVDLLYKAERQTAILKRDVDTLMEKTMAENPGVQPFQVKVNKSPASMRKQQQRIPSKPEPGLLPAKRGDVLFEVLNAQNDRLVKENALIRQKLDWIDAVQARLHTSSHTDTDNLTAPLRELSNKVNYNSGCFNYYSYQPEWKTFEKKEPRVVAFGATYNDDGSIRIRGAVRHPLDGMTLQEIRPDLGGYFSYKSLEKNGDLESGFEIVVKNFDFTKKLAKELPWLDKIPLKIKACRDICYVSEAVYPSVYEITVDVKMSISFEERSAPPEESLTDREAFQNFVLCTLRKHSFADLIPTSYIRLGLMLYGENKLKKGMSPCQ